MSARDLDAACQVIGLAFADNPSTLATVRGDRAEARSTMERAMHVVKLGVNHRHVLVAEHHGRLVGVLNAAPWPACQMGAWQKLKTAPAMLRATGRALPRAARMMSARARHDPGVPHWHIGPIGVHPEHQGRGVGKALLGSFLERIDQQGSPSFLETDVDRNVALYEQFGFAVVARQDILGVDTRFMWRDAPPAAPGGNRSGRVT